MRRPMAWLPPLLAVVAVAEIAVLVLVARWIGLPLAVLALLAASVGGALLLRREGIRAWRRFRQAYEAGEPPGVRVADGLVGLVGALLLAIPGFVTGAVGLLLLAPFVRPLARHRVQRVAEARMSSPMAGNVFGPRRVRVRYQRPQTTPPHGRVADGPAADGSSQHGSAQESAGSRPGESLPGPVLEGEIVDPDGRP